MTGENFRVEVVAHATLRVQHDGFTLLTDPWLFGPIGCNSGFHSPPLVHDPRSLAAETDAIYISHIHPDHFHPPSLELFDGRTPILIGDYRRKEFADKLRRLGFAVVEVPFETPFPVEGTPFEVEIVEHDYEESAAFDSAIVMRTPAFTLFENNDCFLRPAKYERVRDRHRLDYAFLGYSPGSFFPISFEMEEADKRRLLDEAAERRYADFLDAAGILGAGLTVPFANGARFLHERSLWKNVLFNSAAEALRRLRATGLPGDVLGPGDRILADGSVHRVAPVLEREQELAAIAEHAARVREWVEGFGSGHRPVRADLVDRFRDYILGLWRGTRDRLPGVARHVIAYVVDGAEPRHFHFDFSRPEGEIFATGRPPRYDMCYTYPAGGLQARLDGEIDWDELHFSNGVSVHQVEYARDFYRMLRSETLDLG